MGADWLLPGESQSTEHPDDALHWVAVYTELVRFAKDTGGLEDVKIERYRRRLGLWMDRL